MFSCLFLTSTFLTEQVLCNKRVYMNVFVTVKYYIVTSYIV